MKTIKSYASFKSTSLVFLKNVNVMKFKNKKLGGGVYVFQIKED
jgi:hypothetical protein